MAKSLAELKRDIAIYSAMEKAATKEQEDIAQEMKELDEEYERKMKVLQERYDAAEKHEQEVWDAPEGKIHWAAWHEIEKRDWEAGKWMGKKKGTIHFVKYNNVPADHINPHQEVICRMISADKLTEGEGKKLCQFCVNMTEHIRTRHNVPFPPVVE